MGKTRILGPDGKPAAETVRIALGFVPQPVKDAPQDAVNLTQIDVWSSWSRHPWFGAAEKDGANRG